MLKTKICDLLNIEYPVIQGGMAWVSTAELAVAVSNAGGLGIIAAGNAPAEFIRKEIRKAKEMTQKPFGVNLMLLSPFIDEVLKTVLEERVPVITTGAGNPGKYIPFFKEREMKVIPVVPSVALARRLERQGVDAVIAEGTESGGHIGELTTMVLVPQIVDAVDIPVIAAGGIADGRGLVAVLSLGAEGIQMGTRFVCASECTVHPAWKEAFLKAKDRDTVVTGRPTGHPVRILKNKLSKEFERLEEARAPIEEHEKLGEGRLKAAAINGDIDFGSVMAGQIVGMVNEILPAKEIIKRIMTDAENVMTRLKEM